jgi:hypothetical protein
VKYRSECVMDDAYINMEDMSLAYKNAKVDLFYMGNNSLEAVYNYEKNIHTKLSNLRKKIISGGRITKSDWSLICKNITFENPPSDDNSSRDLIYIDPKEEWESQQTGNINANFRLMAKASIDFHILSSLWIAKVGHKYDAFLGDDSYGNRLRRCENGEINSHSMGNFKPYLKPFRDWRDNGFRSMHAALDNKKSLITITADVGSFYHELEPDFLLDTDFLSLLGLKLSDDEVSLTKIFIREIKRWSKSTPLKKGLPVGLPASAIIANLALIELDRLIHQDLTPIYYGRYVDDIILVIENNSDYKTSEEIWGWIIDRVGLLLKYEKSDENKKDAYIRYVPKYLNGCNIIFSNRKNKIFVINGETGRNFIKSIEHQINERSSEWRSLPNLPEDPEDISNDLLSVTKDDGEKADSLNEANPLEMIRSGFALKLRDFEAYERDLPPNAWARQRKAFLNAFIDYVIVLPHFFDLAKYLNRVIQLATICEDFYELSKIIKKIEKLKENLIEKCTPTIKSQKVIDPNLNIIETWYKQVVFSIDESIKAAFPVNLSKQGIKHWTDNFSKDTDIRIETNIHEIAEINRQLYSSDLAHIPFRSIGLPEEMQNRKGLYIQTELTYNKQLNDILSESLRYPGLMRLKKKLKIKDFTSGLVYPCRPFSIPEIFLIFEDDEDVINDVIFSLRGFIPKGLMPRYDNETETYIFETENDKAKLNVAVTSFLTRDSSWVASVMKKDDPDRKRYQRLMNLVNDICRNEIKVDYILLPELSIPPKWFYHISNKLLSRGIVLIAGIEYVHHGQNKVANQVWGAFSHMGLGFPSFKIHKQDKQQAALHEEQKLFELADLQLEPIISWELPHRIQHGKFYFGFLICSELTNIKYRSAFRGKVDVLFIPEWNKDLITFDAIVESSSLDIHAYIVQSNNREYGDSRIRAPYKKDWKRDLVRVKGGINDYYVIGELDIDSLRRFQSTHRSQVGPYKPVPDGFNSDMIKERKMLPVATREVL